MKTNNKLFFTVKVFAVLFLLIALTACLDTMTKQDHAFISKIKERLKHKGDVVRVSDIHSGEWSKVCFTRAGTRDDALRTLSETEKINIDVLKIINRSRSDTNHIDMFVWGIYFFYPPDKVEYFVVYNGDTYPVQLHATTDQYGCVTKELAHFKAMSNQKPNKYRNDSLNIQLTAIKTGE